MTKFWNLRKNADYTNSSTIINVYSNQESRVTHTNTRQQQTILISFGAFELALSMSGRLKRIEKRSSPKPMDARIPIYFAIKLIRFILRHLHMIRV